MKRLAFIETADIVHTGVKGMALALIALQTTSGLPVRLEHYDTATRLGQHVSTCQSAKSAAYDYHILFHALFLSVKPSVDSRLQDIGEHHGREHAHERRETYRLDGRVLGYQHAADRDNEGDGR